MPASVLLSAISLALALAGGDGGPRRIASLNLCTDELVLMLAAPERIVSVTHLAQNEAETPLWRQARRYRRNDGSLISVAAMRPDLVVTMGGGASDRLRLAERLGIPTVDLPFVQSIADLQESIRRLAEALGQRAAGDALLARIAALKATRPRGAGRDAIWLGGGGRTVPAAGIEAEWMALAGLRQRETMGDRVPLETLLVRPPAVLLRSDYRQDQYSNQQRWLAHPAARRLRSGHTIVTDGRLWTCMGPLLIDEIVRLRGLAAR